MKAQLINYAHASNGISLQIMPETDIEEELLQTFWTHGKMDTGHPCKAKGSTGFYITFKPTATDTDAARQGVKP